MTAQASAFCPIQARYLGLSVDAVSDELGKYHEERPTRNERKSDKQCERSHTRKRERQPPSQLLIGGVEGSDTDKRATGKSQLCHIAILAFYVYRTYPIPKLSTVKPLNLPRI
jgi:hypothetical protein